MCQLGDLLVTAPAALREQLDTRRTLEGKASVCARLRPDPDRLADPAQAAKAALRSLGRRINQLGAEAAELEGRLDGLVAAAAPTTVSRLGCGTHHTAALLVAAGENIDRLGSEASFAHLCATAPVPASSGRTSRHRLNFAANRAANRALHMIVLVRLRYCERTRNHMDRRLTEGKTKKGSHPLPQTLRRPRALPHPPSRPRHPHNPHLTSIGTSRRGSVSCSQRFLATAGIHPSGEAIDRLKADMPDKAPVMSFRKKLRPSP